MDKKYCAGCEDDFYNRFDPDKKCWNLTDAKLISRKRVHIDMVPPWNNKKEKYPSCYKQKGFVFFNDDRKC